MHFQGTSVKRPWAKCLVSFNDNKNLRNGEKTTVSETREL